MIPTIGNGILKNLKRRFTVLNFAVFHRNPSSEITSRFFARNRLSFFSIFLHIAAMTDYGDVLTPIFTVYDAVIFDLGRYSEKSRDGPRCITAFSRMIRSFIEKKSSYTSGRTEKQSVRKNSKSFFAFVLNIV